MSNSIACDVVVPMDTFDGEAYMGIWYEIQRSQWQPYGSGKNECTVAHYSNLEDGTFDVYNSRQDDNGSSTREGLTGTGDAIYNGAFYVSFYFFQFSTQPNYWIVDTDYDTYALVHACNPSDEAA